MAHMYAAFFKNISHEMISYNIKLTDEMEKVFKHLDSAQTSFKVVWFL